MTQYSGKLIRKTPLTPTQQSASGVWKLNEQAAAIRNNAWPVAGVPDPISRSCRFRASATAYLSRTFGTPTTQNVFTFSTWMKRGKLSTQSCIFGESASTSNGIYFDAADTLSLYFGSSIVLTTAAVFRDPSAWYHIVWTSNGSTQTIYVNGISRATGTASQTRVNSAIATYLMSQTSGSIPTDGYLTEVNFIDGQALTPSSFGTTDAFTGAWVPMAYTGTYGTNGFYLNFKDNTSTTTLGYDYSGNANNWTANNISLTAGTTYDSMLDVPTPWVGYSTTTDTTAVTRGNYCVLNPLDKNASLNVTNGNLYMNNGGSAAWQGVRGSIGVSTGKWYFEVTIAGTNYGQIGCTEAGSSLSTDLSTGFSWDNRTAPTFTNNDVIGVAFDMDASTYTFYKNNTSALTGSFTSGKTLFPTGNAYSSYGLQFNFGQRPFSYTPPTGFKTLCATNLPDPTIKLGAQYMAASTYTGNGTTQSIVNSGNNTTATTFQPDFVWIKARSIAEWNELYDANRGVGKVLFSNSTGAEVTNDVGGYLSAFNSNGFTVTAGSSSAAGVNQNAATYVGWQWKANGAAVSNTDGSITSQVSAGTTQGFSVVTYTGNGVNGATFGHGLGVAPKMVIVKDRNTTGAWVVWFTGFSNTEYLLLNTTAAKASFANQWGGATPSSTVVSLGNDASLNGNSNTYVSYCWSEVAGYSKFGSYTGNGSTDGPFVYLGFRPRWVMWKRTDSTSSWTIYDTTRSTYNAVGVYLVPDSSGVEGTYNAYDFTANGIKIRGNDASINANGGTYIFAAFAENPFKYSNAR